MCVAHNGHKCLVLVAIVNCVLRRTLTFLCCCRCQFCRHRYTHTHTHTEWFPECTVHVKPSFSLGELKSPRVHVPAPSRESEGDSASGHILLFDCTFSLVLLCLCTVVHFLLEEFRIYLGSSSHTRSTSHSTVVAKCIRTPLIFKQFLILIPITTILVFYTFTKFTFTWSPRVGLGLILGV